MRILIAAALALAAGLPALAQSPLYVVTHVDIAGPILPGATQAQMDTARQAAGDKGKALLLEMGQGCTPTAGCRRFEVLQQAGSPNHLTVVQVWDNRSAFETFEASAAVRSVRERLAPDLGGPLDQRLHGLAK